MSLTLTVPEEIAETAREIATRSGQTTERLLLDVLRAHFPPLPAALQAEFDALESASDEDFTRFEKALEAEQNAAG